MHNAASLLLFVSASALLALLRLCPLKGTVKKKKKKKQKKVKNAQRCVKREVLRPKEIKGGKKEKQKQKK